MSFFKRTCTLSRFGTVGPVQGNLFGDMFRSRLLDHAFHDIDAENGKELAVGWCDNDNILACGFDLSKIFLMEHMALLGYRVDTRSIPAAVLKKHFAIILEEERARNVERDKTFISRERRKELKEQVKLRLLAKTLPVPHGFHALWNRKTDEVWLSTAGGKMERLFTDLFALCFAVPLQALTAVPLAERLLPGKSQELADLRPEPLLEENELGLPQHFLGAEFLLWLWYQAAHHPGGALECIHNVQCADKDSSLNSRGGTDWSAVAKAVLQGKKLTQMSFFHTEFGKDYTFSMSKDFRLQVEPPKVDEHDHEDADAVRLEKISLLHSFCRKIDEYYTRFLELRMGKGWRDEAGAMRRWLEEMATDVSFTVPLDAGHLANSLQDVANKYDCAVEVERNGAKARVTPKKKVEREGRETKKAKKAKAHA